MIRQILAPGLLRRLVTRTMGWSTVALLAFAVPAFYVSDQIIVTRFGEEARNLAANANRGVADRVTFASNAAATIAGLPDVGLLVSSKAKPSLFATYLLPVKSRLRLDVLNVATTDGLVIGAAQDITNGETLPPELLRRAGIKAEEAWVIEDEARGLTVRAISVIRDQSGLQIGLVQAGVLLDTSALASLKQTTDAELVLLVGPTIRASTLGAVSTSTFPTLAETSLTPKQQLTRQVDIGGRNFLGTFSVLPTHNVANGLLAVLVPLAPLEDSQRSLVVVFAGLLVLVLIAGATYSIRLARSLSAPLTALARTTDRVVRGERSVGVAQGAPDEIGQLQAGFAQMLHALGEREAALETTNSDLARANEELGGANTELSRANRLKSEFLANMSHELRTPLNAIIGYSQLMIDGIDGELNAQQIADLTRVTTAGSTLLGLINGLLDIAKIEAGRMEIGQERVDVAAAVAKVADLVRPNAEAKNVVLRTAVPAGLPDVLADPPRFDQILANLASNAVKFTERGSVTIAARSFGGEVVISVADTGIGIAPEAQTYVFDEFRQEDASTTRQYGGTGLGLAIAKKLVELQGGRIWLESSPGAGSTFSFALPSAPEMPVARPEPAVLTS